MIKTAVLLIFIMLLLPFVSFATNSPATLTELEQKSLYDYQQFLDSLDKTDISSTSKAAAQYILTVAPDTQVVKDKAFLAFLQFYTKMSSQLERFLKNEDRLKAWIRTTKIPQQKTYTRDTGETITFDISSNGQAPSESFHALLWRMVDESALSALLERNGFCWASDGEETYCTFHTPDFVTDVFLPYISRSLKEYVLLRCREIPHVYCGDGSIGLSSNELSRRVAAWEQYINEFPNSMLRAESVYLYRAYLGSFLFLDDYKQPELDHPEYEYPRKWMEYIEKYTERKSTEFVREYYLLQENSSFKLDQSDVSDFRNKLEKYLDSLGKGPIGMAWIPGVYLPTIGD
jgi:hypothetical protein